MSTFRAFVECVRAMPSFLLERLEAWAAEVEQAEAQRRADLEKAQRVIREMRGRDAR